MKSFVNPVLPNESSMRINLLHKTLITLGFPVAEDEVRSHTAGKSTLDQVRTVQKKFNVNPDERYVLDETTYEALKSALLSKGAITRTSSFTVRGKVYNNNNTVAKLQQVIALDVDLRGAAVYRTVKTIKEVMANGGFEFLSEKRTDTRGNYYIEFFDFQFAKAERKKADVIVYAIDRTGEIIGRSRLVNAEEYSAQGEIKGVDIIIDKKEERTEYEILMEKLLPFLAESKVTLLELSASTDQVNFAAAELDEREITVQVAAAAESLRNGSTVESRTADPQHLSHELLYALGRNNVRLTWSALYRQEEAPLRGYIAKAVVAKIIKPFSEKEIAAFLQLIHELATGYILKHTAPGQSVPLGKALSVALPDTEQQTAFITAYRDFRNQTAVEEKVDYKKFWSEYLPTVTPFKNKPGLIKSLLFANQLAIVSGNYQPLMEELQVNRKMISVNQLMELNDDEWKTILTKTGVPDFLTGTPENRIAAYAKQVQSFLNAAFPTIRIFSMLKKKELPVKATTTSDGLVNFLSGNSTFDISSSKINDFDKEIRLAAPGDFDNVKTELKRIQRVFQVSTTPKVMGVLMENDLNSAYTISTIPEKSFIQTYGEQLGGEMVARAVYQRAAHTSALSAERAMKIHDVAYAKAPKYSYSPSNQLEVFDLLADALPNYSELFGSPDICECEQCRSVYSAAAYFVELLRFLKWGGKNSDGKSPLQMFEARRPDLLSLPLTCENTNTIIPYVDLVNEVMEYYTVHDKMHKNAVKDTGDATAGELRASPQNIDLKAYKILRNAVYPFSLPYHQPLDVIRTYSDHLRIERHDIMKGMRKDFSAKSKKAIEAEILRISEEDYIVLTGQNFDGVDDTRELHEYFGFDSATDLKKMSGIGVADGIHEFLRRSGMNYTELVALIKTRFINPHRQILEYVERLFADSPLAPATVYAKLKQINAGTLNPANDTGITAAISGKITPAAFTAWVQAHFDDFNAVITLYQSKSLCDLNTTYLKSLKNIYEDVSSPGISTTSWRRINRFIRLWRKLGWTIEEVDIMLTALRQTDITGSTISRLSSVVLLNKNLKLPLNKLATCWGSIDTNGNKSLYQKLFLNKAVQKIDPVFEADQFGAYLTDDTLLIKDHIPAILSAYRMSEMELSTIAAAARIKDNGVERPIDLLTDKLTIYHLSIIYRYTVLSKALKLKVADLCLLIRLFNASPFSILAIPAPANPPATPVFQGNLPSATLEFYELAISITTSGFKPEIVQYIFNGLLPAESTAGLNTEKVKQAARNVRLAFAAIEQDHPEIPVILLTNEIISAKLSLTFQPGIVSQFMSIIDETAVFSIITDPNLVIDIAGDLGLKYNYIKASGRLTGKAVMTDAERAALQAIPGANANFQAAVDTLYKMPEDFIKTNFNGVFTNMNTALAVLLNHPAQAPIPTTEVKLRLIYESYLPLLKQQLRKNAVVQNMAVLIGLSEDITQTIINADLQSLVESLSLEGFTAAYFNNPTLTPPAAIQQTDNKIDFDWGAEAPDISMPANNFSAQWQGHVFPPISGDHTLIVDIKEANEVFNLYLDGILILQKPPADPRTSWEAVVTLNAAQIYKLVLDYTETTGNAGISLSWKTATTAVERIPAAASFPSAVLEHFITTAQVYHRAAKFITGFKLTGKEVSHFVNYKNDFDNIDFKAITAVQFKRINDHIQLASAIPQSQAQLTDVFAAANVTGPAPSMDSLIALINLATAWEINTLNYLIKTYFNFSINDLKNEIAFTRLLRAFSIVSKTGLTAETLAECAKVNTDFTALNKIANLVKSAVKAKYEEEDWLELAGDLSDKVREHQKQALISYLLTKKSLIDHGVKDADGLFEYFLIDVQMGVCMDTSRIVQANAAVQMFVNRCLLNLESDKKSGSEKGVSPNAIDATEWEWMKYYRVWEVNRKIFLYPENWLEPEWRDDRSSFFKELESELVQNDITDRSVEKAFRNYLSKLNTVANLDVCGMYQENYSRPTKLKTLHVFGRTHNLPYQFFYRTCNEFYKWSAWEKVPVDIKMVENGGGSGVHLMPVVWKRRLFIFWPEFVERQGDSDLLNKEGYEPSIDDLSGQPMSNLKTVKYWEMRLSWSENIDGKWAPKQVSKEFLKVQSSVKTDPLHKIFLKSQIRDSGALYITPVIRGKAEARWMHANDLSDNYFVLFDIQSPVETYKNTANDVISNESCRRYNTNFQKNRANSKLEFWGNVYLQNSVDHNVIFSNNRLEKEDASQDPFFYQQQRRSYFVKRADFKVYDSLKRPETSGIAIIDGIVDDSYYSQPDIPSFGPEDLMPGLEDGFLNDIPGNTVPRILVNNPTNPAGPATTGTVMDNNLVLEYDFQLTDMGKVGNAFSDLATGGPTYQQSPFHWEKGLEFHTFYHPYSSQFVTNLNNGGIKGLMNSDTKLNSQKETHYNDKGQVFQGTYAPNFPDFVKKAPVKNDYKASTAYTYYKENICFDVYGANSIYNWELFFHAPLYIATRLSKNGRFEEAMKWFHYIFDPTTDELPLVSQSETARYWKTLPFKTTPAENLQEWFMSLSPDGSQSDENAVIAEWRKNPFKPFVIARNRPVAFMKNVVIKYVENLRLWGDSLFRMFTRESVNEALQLYVIANHILGPRPEFVPKRGEIKAESYNSLKDKWDDFSNALVELENIFPFSSEVTVTGGNGNPGTLGIGKALYFCIPSNEKLMEHWDTVADRLYKIRHCMDIDGVERQLALFSPPIDPAMLINAAAQGLSLGSILSDLSSPPPVYRFNFLLQKANEFCSEVKSLGSALLSALEKKDGEELGRLRSSHETAMLELMTAIKERQVLDARSTKAGLLSSRKTAEFRVNHYNALLGDKAITIPAAPQIGSNLNVESQLPADTQLAELKVDADDSLVASDTAGIKIIKKEQQQIDDANTALDFQDAATIAEGIAAGFHAVPELYAFATPWGVGGTTSFGGSNLGSGASALAKIPQIIASHYTQNSTQAAQMASYIRREQDWTLQANLAIKEIIQLDKQITSADIKIQVTEKELINHRQQIENSKLVEQFLKDKFTNLELYQWMKEQLFFVYKQSYNMAYDMAKKVEKCYQYELGNNITSFITYGYWDSSTQGLCSGEKLQLAMRQMEKSYIELNKRELELTKSVSIALLAPLALQKLRTTGQCVVAIPEEAYDLDYQGHYFRRIKSVSLSLPCIAGPFTTVNCTLRLLKNKVRINTSMGDNGYEHNNDEGVLTDDDRFSENNVPVKAIATSTGQRDTGMFELSFRDERYLPFEGAGAISEWKIELTKEADLRQFDYATIADVILHISYTAREDVGLFRDNAVTYLKNFLSNAAELSTQPLMRMFNIKQEFSTEWHKFLNPAATSADQLLSINLNKDHFPFFARTRSINIKKVEVLIKADRQGDYKMVFSAIDSGDDAITSSEIFMPENEGYANMQKATLTEDAGTSNINVAEIDIFKPIVLKFKHNADTDFHSIGKNPEEISDLFIVLHYSLGDL